MNDQTFTKRILGLTKYFLLVFSILLIFSVSSYSQNIEYSFKGRVVDDQGNPIKDAGVLVDSNSNYCHMIKHSFTDENGMFEYSFIGSKEAKYYLYVSKDFLDETIKVDVDVRQLIGTPFHCSGLKGKKYLGKRINLERNSLVDLGDVKVQYWFASVYPKLTINGNKLTKDQWLKLWISLKDENGKPIYGVSVGPKLTNDEVDLEKSILKLLLPEGKWKLEFQLFDNEELIIHPEIIGETPFFTIDKNVEPEIIEVKINNEKAKL